MQELSSEGGVDVVFLGSSMVDVGIDPETFVENSDWAEVAYNAALSSASLGLIEVWANEVVFPLLQPRVVVIGISSRELNDNGLAQQQSHDRYMESIGRAEYLGELSIKQGLELAAEDVSALYRLRKLIRVPGDFADLLLGTTKDNTITEYGYETRMNDRRYQVSEIERVLSLNDYQGLGGRDLPGRPTSHRGGLDSVTPE
jgi:hypothetical protein